jgi:UDP-N-acetyl-D-glucosamine dehydrogenase
MAITRTAVLIIGLGYVGLPVVALVNSLPQYQVTGYDLDVNKIKAITHSQANWIDKLTQKRLKKTPLIVTADSSTLANYDIIVMCVPTPVDDQDLPNLEPVLGATATAATLIKPKGLIILESTVNPGVSEEILIPLLEKTGLTVGQDVFLAHCPERIDPGNAKFPLQKIPRVLGADSPEGLAKAKDFYESFLKAPVTTVSSLRAAEASKIVENAFRDINIAFVNELAQSFAHFDIDVTEVINAASTKPFGFLAHYPGCGVGGHCIPVDPYYLIESAHQKGYEHRFLKLAREINRGMPAYTVDLLLSELSALRLDPQALTIGVLGTSYKPGIGDQRNSPAMEIFSLLEAQGRTLARFDPFVSILNTHPSLEELRSDPQVQALIIATNHTEFITSLEQEKWPYLKLIVDGRNCLSKWPKGVVYKGIGK